MEEETDQNPSENLEAQQDDPRGVALFFKIISSKSFWELFFRSFGWSVFTIALATGICGFSNFLFGVEKHFGGVSTNVFAFESLKTDQIYAIALALNSAIIVEYIYHLTLQDCIPVEDFVIVLALGFAIFQIVISDAIHRKHETEKMENCERQLAQAKQDFFKYERIKSRMPEMIKNDTFSQEDAKYHLQLLDSLRAKWWSNVIVDTSILSNKRFYTDSLNPNLRECNNEFGVRCRHFSKMSLLVVLLVSILIRVRMGYSVED